MSNVSVNELPADYDKRVDRLPFLADPKNPLAHDHQHLVEILEDSLFDGGRSTGLTYKIAFQVVESPVASLVGRKFVHMITQLKGVDADLKARNLKEYHAAALKIDPTSEQNWRQIAGQVVQSQFLKGRKVRMHVSAPRNAKTSGKPFCQVTFSQE